MLTTDTPTNAAPGQDFNSVHGTRSADYLEWQKQFGKTTNQSAGGNGDGRVDAADYVIWRKQMSASEPQFSLSSVPEPETIFFASSMFAVSFRLMAVRRLRRRTLKVVSAILAKN